MPHSSPAPGTGTLYRTFWRWHFYAGLFVIPFVMVLALSGTAFLFKPQIERWEERAFQGLPATPAVSPRHQAEAALAAFPGARFHSYRLPQHDGDAALIHLASPGTDRMRDVFVSPQGAVLGSFDTGTRIVEVARRIHGQLLLGRRGSWLVELAACWSIVMLVTGLYLWWPRGSGAAGVIWPRRGTPLRDLHAVTGFWVATFALILLLTGLPWTDVWGNAFGAVRAQMGWVKGAPHWSTDGATAPMRDEHASHDHGAMHAGHAAHDDLARLDDLVARAAGESLAFPAVVLAPGAALFGPPSPDWIVTSTAQNRPLGLTITYDGLTGGELARETFADRHPIDRVVGYGLAWHEGALFGAVNQLIGVLTAAALVTMSATGLLMWWRRRPSGALGAPPLPVDRRKPVFVAIATLTLALLLPLLAASLLLLWLIDALLPRISPAAATWLGLARRSNAGDLPGRIACVVTVPAAALLLGATPGHAGEANPDTLETVVVTAERIRSDLEAERAATPGAVTVLDGNALHERGVTQLADMLRYVPGVWAESYNGNDDVFYSSRGSNLDATDYDKNGVKFLQDGLPVTAADGNNHNRALDPLNTRYVTVAHGANALAYGASTLGGAVDFTSPTARTSAPFSVSLSGGSFGQWGARATLGGVSGALDGLISAETQQRDGYREHSRQDRRNVYANLGWQAGENVTTRFHATYSDYYAELPRELSPAQFAADPRQARSDAVDGNHSKDVEAFRLAFKTTVAEVAGGTLELGASYEEQSLYHPIVSTPFFSLLIDTTHKDSGAMLRYRHAAGAHGLVFGANYGFSKINGGNYENIGGERGALMWPSDDDASTLELFALDRWNLAPRWTLVYGAQFVTADRDAGGFKGSYDAFNPRLGVIFGVNADSEWYASASRVYEAPTTFELVDDANGGGTPLDAMHGVVVETGLRGAASRGATRLTWDVSGYYTALRDEILSIDDPDAPGTSLSANIAKTTHAGIEALLGASFAVGEGRHRIEPLVSATFNAFSFDSDPEYGDNRLPAAPRWFARGEVMYAHASGFRAGPTFDFVGPRQVDFANTYRVGSYGLLGARAGFNTGHWELYAEARNLLDRKYVATVVVKDRAGPGLEMLHPGAPRSVYFGARYRF